MLKRTVMGVITSLVIVASSIAIASPAQAYDNSQLDINQFYINTTNCPCTEYDPADNTYFQKDVDGYAIKLEIYYPGRGMVAKVEWHPYGEYLWVYDTRNDGDTIYVVLYNSTTGNSYGPYRAPGTDTVVEYRRVNLSFTENDGIYLDVYDGANRTDYIGSSSRGRA